MTGPLSGHKREHIRRPDPPGTLLHDGKEDLQVVGHRQHRVRSAPPGQELQILIEQRNAEADLRVAGRSDGANQTRADGGHTGAFSLLMDCRVLPRQNVHEDHPHIKQKSAFATTACGSRLPRRWRRNDAPRPGSLHRDARDTAAVRNPRQARPVRTGEPSADSVSDEHFRIGFDVVQHTEHTGHEGGLREPSALCRVDPSPAEQRTAGRESGRDPGPEARCH
jgi:hypothetical protein